MVVVKGAVRQAGSPVIREPEPRSAPSQHIHRDQWRRANAPSVARPNELATAPPGVRKTASVALPVAVEIIISINSTFAAPSLVTSTTLLRFIWPGRSVENSSPFLSRLYAGWSAACRSPLPTRAIVSGAMHDVALSRLWRGGQWAALYRSTLPAYIAAAWPDDLIFT